MRSITDEEIGAAFDLFKPVVRMAASDVGLRSRVRYPKARKLRELPPRAAEMFNRFCVLASKTNLHPCDVERFLRFIRYCHARRLLLSEGEVFSHLRKGGFAEAVARRLAEQYEFGRQLMYCRFDWANYAGKPG
ncbi:MAG: hypothetical protein QM770_14435 [Tepidisphaeraceae bacterium]